MTEKDINAYKAELNEDKILLQLGHCDEKYTGELTDDLVEKILDFSMSPEALGDFWVWIFSVLHSYDIETSSAILIKCMKSLIEFMEE